LLVRMVIAEAVINFESTLSVTIPSTISCHQAVGRIIERHGWIQNAAVRVRICDSSTWVRLDSSRLSLSIFSNLHHRCPSVSTRQRWSYKLTTFARFTWENFPTLAIQAAFGTGMTIVSS
uniref:ACT domain-containing protein n=1 Tax=Heligmosomoides polygyrus TaxID=6339 RepID=A0A183G1U0_HELPZ